MKPGNLSNAIGTGGTHFDFLQQHVTDTENSRIPLRAKGRVASFGEGEGYISPGVPQIAEGPLAMMPPVEPHAFWSVDGKHGLLSTEPMWGLEDWDLWKAKYPEKLHGALEALLDLAGKLPSLCVADGPIYERCEEAQEVLKPLSKESKLLHGLSEDCRERLRVVLAMLAAGCIAMPASVAGSRRRAPKCIEWPLQLVSRLVGRPTEVGFTELVLCNWKQRVIADYEKPVGPEPVMRFLSCPEEEWWRQLDMVLHQSAYLVVQAVRAGQASLRTHDDKNLVSALEKVTEWLDSFCLYFDANFEAKDSRTEAVNMQRLMRFTAAGYSEEQLCCQLYCSGSSVLMPVLHAFLGVSLLPGSFDGSDTVERSLRRWLEERRSFMPRLHLRFLEELERGWSMRRYCFKRFSMPKVAVEQLHNLEVAYNDALNNLVRFLSRRFRLVSRLLPNCNFAPLHGKIESHMRAHRVNLLEMRQRVMRCHEHHH